MRALPSRSSCAAHCCARSQASPALPSQPHPPWSSCAALVVAAHCPRAPRGCGLLDCWPPPGHDPQACPAWPPATQCGCGAGAHTHTHMRATQHAATGSGVRRASAGAVPSSGRQAGGCVVHRQRAVCLEWSHKVSQGSMWDSNTLKGQGSCSACLAGGRSCPGWPEGGQRVGRRKALLCLLSLRLTHRRLVSVRVPVAAQRTGGKDTASRPGAGVVQACRTHRRAAATSEEAASGRS